MDKQIRIQEIREKTKEDVLKKLKTYHKCMIIRPTGYGKTFLMTELAGLYQHVLYLYPAEVIADTVRQRYCQLYDMPDADTIESIRAMRSFANVDMMTYAKLIRLSDDELQNMSYDAIIIDEAHRIGAIRTMEAISQLLANLPNADLIGATATPNRTDSFDVTSVFFSSIMSFPYTLHDAMQDQMLLKPNYCFCTYDVETDLKEEALTAGEDLNDPEVLEVLNRKLIELSKIYNMPNIIRNVCDQYAKDTNSMKFIVFFSSIRHMNDKLPDVISWFQEAYPTHHINSLRISSSSKQESINVKELESLKPADKTIHLIGCIDMLNMGYHVNDLTGIVMYRGTKSDIIYVQQLGRALSSGTDHASIVFDVVDNLHRKAVYDLTGKQRLRAATALRKTPWYLADDGTIRDAQGRLTPVVLQGDHITDLQGNPTHMYVDPTTRQVYCQASDDDWYLNANLITSDDVHHVSPLFAEGHMATYRELLAKAVAEPMSQRCRMAIHIHFRKWCEAMNVPYPITKEELDRMNNISSDDFVEHFKTLLASKHLDYPLQDAEQLLAFGEDDTDRIPLRICAKIKNVSVRAILDLLELAG